MSGMLTKGKLHKLPVSFTYFCNRVKKSPEDDFWLKKPDITLEHQKCTAECLYGIAEFKIKKTPGGIVIGNPDKQFVSEGDMGIYLGHINELIEQKLIDGDYGWNQSMFKSNLGIPCFLFKGDVIYLKRFVTKVTEGDFTEYFKRKSEEMDLGGFDFWYSREKPWDNPAYSDFLNAAPEMKLKPEQHDNK